MPKRTKLPITLAIFVIFASCLVLLVWTMLPQNPQPYEKDTLTFTEDDALMKKEVARHAPPGSDIRQAKRLLEKNGFGCSILVNARFVKNRSFAQVEQSGQKAELSCVKAAGERDWLGYKTGWSIDIPFRENKITDINVSHATIRWFNCCL